MTQTIITAGDASTGLVTAAGNDGTLVLQSGPAGSKVNALVLDATGKVSLPVAPVFSAGANAITVNSGVATTSGSSAQLTGIPSWVKRITIVLNSVSTNGSNAIGLQLGSGSLTTTGYVGNGSTCSNAGGMVVATSSTYFMVGGAFSSAQNRYGHITLTNVGSNVWMVSAVLGDSGVLQNHWMGGGVALSGALDRVALITADTFDNGSYNVLWE